MKRVFTFFLFITALKSNAQHVVNNDPNPACGAQSQNVRSTRIPKEFPVVKLNVIKNYREVTIGKGNVINYSFSNDEKSIIHFTTKKVAKGVYEISPESALHPESTVSCLPGCKSRASSKVFDFSIRIAKSF